MTCCLSVYIWQDPFSPTILSDTWWSPVGALWYPLAGNSIPAGKGKTERNSVTSPHPFHLSEKLMPLWWEGIFYLLHCSCMWLCSLMAHSSHILKHFSQEDMLVGCQVHSVASCFSQTLENVNIRSLLSKPPWGLGNSSPAVRHTVCKAALEHILDIFLGLVGKTRI